MSKNQILFSKSAAIIFLIINSILAIFFLSYGVSDARALSLGPPVYSDSPPPAGYSACPVQSTCTGPNVCWNSERVGVTDCGTACSGGNAWSKYTASCLLDPTDPSGETCFPYYERTDVVCSTADKCTSTSSNPYLNSGRCDCSVGGIYKTCCSNTSPSLVSGDSCVELDVDNLPPPEGVCPGGTHSVQCGFGGNPPCGQAACGPTDLI